MRRLEELVERGNMVEVTVAAQTFVVLVSDADFTYRRSWDISYTLSFDVDRRKDDARQEIASPFTVEKPGQSVDDVTAIADQMGAAHAKRPPGLLGATLAGAAAGLRATNEALANMQDAVRATTGRGSTIGEFQRLAIQAQNVQGNCAAVAESLISVRSDLETGIRTAAATMQLEIWAKTLGYLSRLAMWRAMQARNGLAERQTPKAKRLYRPRKGQSLMAVSREVYGTPYGHRVIARANRLHSLYLEGTEILVIPEG
jgi:nucleoid-associated protein YgaU